MSKNTSSVSGLNSTPRAYYSRVILWWTLSQSLAWWRDAVYLDVLIVNTSSQIDLVKVMARSTAPGLIARRGLPRSPWNPYGEPRKKKIASTRISKLSGDQAARYTGALERQGEIWRTLLTGEKDAADFLTPQDYVSASKATLAEMASVALQAARALWLPLAAVSALAAALIVGLVFVHNASGGSKIAGYVASAVVYVAAVWRTAGSRVASLARKLEEPLWGASIDSQLALAMTLPPAGTADPSGWVAFVDQARADEAKPKESRDAHNETKSRTQPHPGREPTRPTGTPSAEV